MARYRIEFSRDWIRGRWGYIDRIFYKLGGRETEPSRTENAWLVEFGGTAKALGAYLTERLELKREDLSLFGAIFEISEVSSPNNPSSKRSSSSPRRKRLTAPRT